MIFTFIVCGVAALTGGFIDAIAGGGGLVTVPALLVCGISPHAALATNKISAFLGTTVALFNFSRNHLVLWKLVGVGITFSLVGSWVGTLMAVYLDSQILGKIIVALLPLGMVATLIPPQKNQTEHQSVDGMRFWVATPLLCLLIGIYDGFFGPGTGSFLILALHWCLGLGLVHASATAKAFNLGSNLSGAVSFMWYGMVNWPLGIFMAACLMTGNWIGSNLAIRVGAKAVRKFLFVSLLLLLVTLIWQFFFK